MISTLRGKILHKGVDHVIVDVAGVGFMVFVPLSIWDKLNGQLGEEITLFTHLHVREDALSLFGFASRDEEQLFIQLLNVSGMGPRSALKVLSAVNPADFTLAVLSGDVSALTALPGIGKKTAHRIILDLKERLPEFVQGSGHIPVGAPVADALAALISLGYGPSEAAAALQKTQGEADESNVEDLVRLALRQLL